MKLKERATAMAITAFVVVTLFATTTLYLLAAQMDLGKSELADALAWAPFVFGPLTGAQVALSVRRVMSRGDGSVKA